MTKIPLHSGKALLAGLVCSSLGGLAYAQDDSRRIEEVIITAERQEASIQDTSISITAFTDKYIDDFGIRNQEDLQNFVPAMTIQPYDATVRGVGRNFRNLGGDPGVAAYVNGVYSEDLLTATAATFWDVSRIEVLRGPQGTLYGRNAVGGAINILYKPPTDEAEWAVKAIAGNFGTQELYGMVSGPLIEDVLTGRINFSLRDRDGVIEDVGGGEDLDGLGTDHYALQLKWNISDSLVVDFRQNQLKIDRSFGGADGAGLVVLNDNGVGERNTTQVVPGYRFVDSAQTDPLANDYQVAGESPTAFTDPITGVVRNAQINRPGIDYSNLDGAQNAAASLDGFNNTGTESAALLNECVFSGDIDGEDVCAATNGLNREQFDQQGLQFSVSWDATEDLQLKYIYGFNKLSYRRTTDDDNTASQFHDRQFYVNHEADYTSHELQAFYNFSDDFSITSGIFFYEATIDQRGDFYSSLNEARLTDAYEDNTALSAGGAAFLGAPSLEGISITDLAFGPDGAVPMATLFSAKNACNVADPAAACARNYSVDNSNADLDAEGLRSDNLYASKWYGDDGTNDALNVIHGPDTRATDLLYATQTERDAFAAYTQAVWDINETFTLTMGIRYASDEVTAEENLFRYTESDLSGLIGLYGGVYGLNAVNGGFETDGGVITTNADGQPTATTKATNGGVPIAISVYRGFKRKDTKVTGRLNLDWNVDDSTLMYFSVTSGYRSGGYNLVFFSTTPSYEPEELIAYEIGYKSQFLDDTVQLNASTYFYDYETIHTVGTEVNTIGGTSNSVLEAPGAEIKGVEAELLWLATENLTLGGNFSFTPSEYTEDLFVSDTSGIEAPGSLYPGSINLEQNINGNQLLQVPETKYTAWASYRFPLDGGSAIEVFGVYTWIDEVYYSPFESENEVAPSYARTDFRATWTSADEKVKVSGFVNNITDEVGVLFIGNNSEQESFRQGAGTTLPRMFGIEFSYATGL